MMIAATSNGRRRESTVIKVIMLTDKLDSYVIKGLCPEVWAKPWSTTEMLDGQHQRVNIPARARTAHKGLLQKRLEEDLS